MLDVLHRAFKVYMLLAHRLHPPLPEWTIKTVVEGSDALVKAAKAGTRYPSIPVPAAPPPPIQPVSLPAPASASEQHANGTTPDAQRSSAAEAWQPHSLAHHPSADARPPQMGLPGQHVRSLPEAGVPSLQASAGAGMAAQVTVPWHLPSTGMLIPVLSGSSAPSSLLDPQIAKVLQGPAANDMPGSHRAQPAGQLIAGGNAEAAEQSTSQPAEVGLLLCPACSASPPLACLWRAGCLNRQVALQEQPWLCLAR